MATDYNAPRNADADQQGEPALQAIAGAQSSRAADPGGDLDPVEGEVALASADPTDEELVVPWCRVSSTSSWGLRCSGTGSGGSGLVGVGS